MGVPNRAAQTGGQGGSQLEGGPLPSGRAPHQVSENGGQEDEGGGAQLQALRVPHGYQHQVGAPVLFHAAHPVQQHDGRPGQGKQPDDPGVLPPQLGGQLNAQVEGNRHQAHDYADQAGIQQPLDKKDRVGQACPGRLGQLRHKKPLLSPGARQLHTKRVFGR